MKKKGSVRYALVGNGMLLCAAVIWGFAFSFQDRAGETLGSLSVNALRFFLGGLVLIPAILCFDRLRGNHRRLFSFQNSHFIGLTPREIFGGMLCGAFLGAASCLQQAGIAIEETGVGNAAFITALYVVMVPLFDRLFGKKQAWSVWASALLAVLGFYLMTVAENGVFAPKMGDILILLSAVLFAGHILVIDRLVSSCDPVRISMIQFLTIGMTLLPISFLIESPSFSDVFASFTPILYLGICSCGIAYTLQVVGQKYANPTTACMVLSLESVFGAIGGAIILGEHMSFVQMLGAGIVFVAILLSQLKIKK